MATGETTNTFEVTVHGTQWACRPRPRRVVGYVAMFVAAGVAMAAFPALSDYFGGPRFSRAIGGLVGMLLWLGAVNGRIGPPRDPTHLGNRGRQHVHGS